MEVEVSLLKMLLKVYRINDVCLIQWCLFLVYQEES